MSDKLTKEQIQKKVDAQAKKFMKAARAFLATKGGGELRPEWELGLMMLDAYYRQFVELQMQISQLDSLVIESRYGPQPTPLLACRDKASVRLEALMKEMGLSLKSALKLNVVDAKKEETALDKFLKAKTGTGALEEMGRSPKEYGRNEK